jgi:hypothetical protein
MHATNPLSGTMPAPRDSRASARGTVHRAVEYQRRSFCTLSIRWAAGAVACLVELKAGRVSYRKVLLIDILAHGRFQYIPTSSLLVSSL